MSYKDKVKKAMELIELESSDEKLSKPFELGLGDQVLQKFNYSYCFVTHGTLLCIDADNIVYLDVDSEILELPHIKTLQQFEDLYKALTGKELSCD